MLYHFSFQAVIIVWVFLISGELKLKHQHLKSIMARHSVHLDITLIELLSGQSSHHIKQIVSVVNGQQEYEKKSFCHHTA